MEQRYFELRGNYRGEDKFDKNNICMECMKIYKEVKS